MLQNLRTLAAGESYWKVRLERRIDGKVKNEWLSELDTKLDIRNARTRKVEWLEDLIGSGDLRNIAEVLLCTPKGEAHLNVLEPYTVFQFSRGVQVLLGGRTQKIKQAQIIGVVTNKESGECLAAIWDIQQQQLYSCINNVKHFKAWRQGIADVGALNLQALDVRLS